MQETQPAVLDRSLRRRLEVVVAKSRIGQRRQTLMLLGIFVLVVLGLNAQNLLKGGIPVHGDLTFPWSLDNYLENYRYLFSDSGSISNLESIDRAAILLPLSLLADILGFGTGFVYRVLYLGIPLVSMLSMLCLLRFVLARINPSWARIAVLLPACVIYALSPWVLEQVQAYLFWLAYALTPLLFVLTFRLFERGDLRSAIYLALVLTAIATTPQYLVFSWIALVVIGVAQLASMKRRRTLDRSQSMRIARAAGVLLATFVVLNFYWIYPSLNVLNSGRTVSPGFEADPGMTQLFSTNSSALNVLRGHDQWIRWYQADTRLGFTFNRVWILNSLIVPAMSFAALLYKPIRSNREIRVIALLGLAFAGLALGTTTPIYDWLVFNVPFVRSFGWVLRVPGKLSYMLWTLYAVMIAIVIAKLLDAPMKRGIKVGIAAVLLASMAISILPKTLIYFFDYYAPVKTPGTYEQLHAFLRSNSDGVARVLYLAPYDFAFGDNSLRFETSYTWNPNRLAAASPAISAPSPSIAYYHLTYRDWQHSLYPSIYPRIPLSLGQQHLADAGVRYVVYHNDIVGAEGRGQKDIARLQRSDLTPVASFGNIRLFENPFYRGLFRAETGQGELSPARVSKISPAEFRIELPAQANSLIMGQPFDAMWVMNAGGDVVSPQPSDGVGMRFEISAGVTEVTVEYFPQPFYDAGLAVSGIGFLLVGVSLLPIRKVGSAWRLRAGSRQS